MERRKILDAVDEVMESLIKSARLYIKSINKKRYLEAESHADILVCESARLHRAARLLMGDNHPLDTDDDDETEEPEVEANDDNSDDGEEEEEEDEEEEPVI